MLQNDQCVAEEMRKENQKLEGNDTFAKLCQYLKTKVKWQEG